MSYGSIEAIKERCKKEGIEFWKAVQIEDCSERNVSEESSWKEMTRMWRIMCETRSRVSRTGSPGAALWGKRAASWRSIRKRETPCAEISWPRS